MTLFKRWLAASGAASLLVGLAGTMPAFASEQADAISVMANSGTAIDNILEGSSASEQLVGKFTDTGRPGGGACLTEGYVATINWGDGSSSTGTVACERDASSDNVTTGIFDVRGTHAYVENGAYDITLSVVDSSESGEASGAAVKTDTAAVVDAELFEAYDNSNDGSYAAAEGQSISVLVGFGDDRAFPGDVARDSSIAATIDWGDGSALQTVAGAAPTCDCSSQNVEFRASHAYDAAGTRYKITVTARDDGGRSAAQTFWATIGDGMLTAGANASLSGIATTPLTGVVGSFTDAAGAQAAVGDFAATINWGDNATSANWSGSESTGTVTKTASGAFSVSGTHTYASAGSKSITVTVTDEDGTTVTLHATASIAAIVLPATGQPASSPGLPWATLALMALIAVAGAGLVLRRRS